MTKIFESYLLFEQWLEDLSKKGEISYKKVPNEIIFPKEEDVERVAINYQEYEITLELPYNLKEVYTVIIK